MQYSSRKRPNFKLFQCFALAAFVSATTQAATAQVYEFGESLNYPVDVAAYNPCKSGFPDYIFVADGGANELVRFSGVSNNAAVVSATDTAIGVGPFGVAVDDSCESPNQGQVYTTMRSGGVGLVSIYQDTNINSPNLLSLGSSSLGNIQRTLGIAVDKEGNLYVCVLGSSGAGAGVLKVSAAQVKHPGWPNSTIAVISEEFIAPFSDFVPFDVSVDKVGRVHVTYRAGTIQVYNPDGTPFGSPQFNATTDSNNGFAGIDAKGDLLRTRFTDTAQVVEWDWDLVNWDISNGISSMATSHSMLGTPRGVEYQKYLKSYTVGRFTSEERVLVVHNNPGPKVAVFESVFQSTQIPHGAQARWRFDETSGVSCFDDINGHTLTMNGTAERVDGKVRCGLGLNASSARASLADHDDFDFGSGDLSIEGWICSTNLSIDTFVDKRTSGNGYSAFLYGGFLGFQLNGASNWENFHPFTVENFVADGKWHHVAISVQRSSSTNKFTRLYVDGVLTGTDPTPQEGSISNNADLVLGAAGLRGRLDDLAIYDRALTPMEVIAIYNAGSAGKHKSMDDPFEDNDSCATPGLIGPGSYTNFIDQVDLDFYTIDVPASTTLDVDISNFSGFDMDFNVYVGGCSATPVLEFDDFVVHNPGPGMLTVVFEALADPTASSDPNTFYDLDIALIPDLCIGVADDTFENNDDCATASPVGDGTYSNLFVTKSDKDHYAFCVAPGATVTCDILFTNSNGDLDFFLREATSTQCGLGNGTEELADGFSISDNETLTWTNTTGSDVNTVLEVNVWPGNLLNCNNYDLIISGSSGCGDVGTTFCDPNSLNCNGVSTTLSANFGSGIGSDLHLTATNGPSSEFGYFLVSAGMADPGIQLSRGNFCLLDGVNPFGRYIISGSPSNSIGQFSGDGLTFQNLVGTGTSAGGTGFDVPATAPVTGTPALAGGTWNFQLWHRDACMVAGASNFSNGLSVTFP